MKFHFFVCEFEFCAWGYIILDKLLHDPDQSKYFLCCLCHCKFQVPGD